MYNEILLGLSATGFLWLVSYNIGIWCAKRELKNVIKELEECKSSNDEILKKYIKDANRTLIELNEFSIIKKVKSSK
jgi:hypothetical protein